MPIKRDAAPRPALPKEVVKVEALGGEVVVQGLLLSEKMAFASNGYRHPKMVTETLALCVRDDDGEPLYTAEEWDIFGAQHQEAVLELFSVAQRLSGMSGDEKKNETPS